MSSKITIPKPCHENWENMSPDEKGKFCKVCTKSVYDFTEKSNAEIIRTMANSEEKICGRFLTSQLDQPQNYFQKRTMQLYRFSHNNFRRNSFALFIVSVLMTLTGCKKKLTGDVAVLIDNDSTKKCATDSTKKQIMGKPIMLEDTAQIPKNHKK